MGSVDIKAAIESGEAEGLRLLLSANPACADQAIEWGERGKNRAHPLHYVCDMIFEGTLSETGGLALVELLLDAGADVDFQVNEKSDSPLIGAASLHAEGVGSRLVAAGARVELTGFFGETALHWAAHEGLERLVGVLIEAGAPLDVHDTNWKGLPLDWALHGWIEGMNPGKTGTVARHGGVVERLVGAGSAVEPAMIGLAESQPDPALRASMLAALTGT